MSDMIPRLYFQDIDRESGKAFLRPATVDDLMQISDDLARKQNAADRVISFMQYIPEEDKT